MAMPHKTVLALLVATVLAGCGGRDDVTLTRIRHTGNGPDEFSIMPGKPLQAPEDYASLPSPTPGGANRTDQNPLADGVAALGGNPAALTAGAPSARDGALVNHATRYGATANIRQTLSEEDSEIRRRHGRVNILRLGPKDDYTNAYKRQWLDAYAEERRLRRNGTVTPSSPPPPK
ncbi:Beta-barrel assembly machine subunit BamF [Roseovarius marisflavi]|uniref:Beta-barrel assembly machine subunit BamF n=1 Tax=Roseovarius marisflavi TaxID=1054996 RepID=A0A1M7B590_9RHOB|nr:DUF3035 domain-containing protein [Roseovarius marisflavi]SHL49799.1 Beta-barrel assembly machine subunit BamF [Roseovarius marisflavi]